MVKGNNTQRSEDVLNEAAHRKDGRTIEIKNNTQYTNARWHSSHNNKDARQE